MTDSRRDRSSAFTVIEVLTALTILGMMMAIAWGTISSTVNAKRYFGRIQDRSREVRIAMNRLVHDFSVAYISANEDRTLMEPRTLFVGESSGTYDTARFSAFAHVPLFADANESDETVIEYLTASDPEDRSLTDLMRRELRRPLNSAEPFASASGETEIALAGVTKFKLSYWDVQDREWKDSWSTQQTDGNAPRLPDRVRIVVGYLDEHGREVVVTTQAKVHLQETLQFYTN